MIFEVDVSLKIAADPSAVADALLDFLREGVIERSHGVCEAGRASRYVALVYEHARIENDGQQLYDLVFSINGVVEKEGQT